MPCPVVLENSIIEEIKKLDYILAPYKYCVYYYYYYYECLESNRTQSICSLYINHRYLR